MLSSRQLVQFSLAPRLNKDIILDKVFFPFLSRSPTLLNMTTHSKSFLPSPFDEINLSTKKKYDGWDGISRFHQGVLIYQKQNIMVDKSCHLL